MQKPPIISAILACYYGKFSGIQRTISHLLKQTIVDQLELVIVSPFEEDILAYKEVFAGFHSYQIIVDKVKTLAEGNATGIRAAHAPIIVLCEDHCFPDPDWAQHLVAAHAGNWAAVGPCVGNANPDNFMSWASLAMDYNEWLTPLDSGVKSHIPGHNSSYKKDVLLEYGENLGLMLEAESILHWDLQKKGYQVYLESKAKTYHLNFEKLGPWFSLLFHCNRRFAACRSMQWPWTRRLFYACAGPLIPFIRLVRIRRELSKPGRFSGNHFPVLCLIFFGLIIAGTGEFLGYTLGFGNVLEKASTLEFDRIRFLKKPTLTRIAKRQLTDLS